MKPTPQLFNTNIDGRVKHLRRSADAVLKKIQRVYGLSDEDVALPATVPLTFPANKEVPRLEKWYRYCDDQAGAWHALYDKKAAAGERHEMMPGERDRKKREWTDAGNEIMRRYQQGFHVRGKLWTMLDQDKLKHRNAIYASYDNQNALVNIYINHLTNLANAELIDLGLSEEGAHKLNGWLIKGSIDRHDALGDGTAWVMPGHNRHSSTHAEIELVRRYWQSEASDLQCAYRDNQLGH